MARQLQKAILYVLKLEDPSGGPIPPFYKIGITTDTVEKRIRQLQTGNPFRIVPHTTYSIEGAELVERHLHRMFTNNRRILEWFALSDDELSEVLSEAERFRDEVEDLVVAVRGLDETYSDDRMIDPTSEATALHLEAVRLHAEKIQNDLRMKEAKAQILKLTDVSKGIEGISQVSIYSPKTSFRKADLKKHEPKLYDQYMTLSEFKSSLKVIGQHTPSKFPKLYDANKAAQAQVPKVSPDDVKDEYLKRTNDAVQLHTSYIMMASDNGLIERDLTMVRMKLKVICGDARGIRGVCEYVREDRLTFDVDRFKVEHPDVHSRFTTLGTTTRRATVKRSRDY